MLAVSLFSLQAFGHTIEGGDASFVEAIDGPAIGPFIYLGAKHMVTGYDHLLFLWVSFSSCIAPSMSYNMSRSSPSATVLHYC